MDKNKYANTLEIAKSLNRLLLIGFFGLVLACVGMGFSIYRLIGHKTVILMPPVMSQQMTVSDVKPDASYLQQMSLFLMGLKLNVTPNNVQYNFELLLDYVDAKAYPSLLDSLSNQAKFVKKQKLSAVFYADDVQVDPKHLMTKVSGVIEKTVGTRRLDPEKVSYLMEYKYNNGVLSIVNITKEDKK